MYGVDVDNEPSYMMNLSESQCFTNLDIPLVRPFATTVYQIVLLMKAFSFVFKGRKNSTLKSSNTEHHGLAKVLCPWI